MGTIVDILVDISQGAVSAEKHDMMVYSVTEYQISTNAVQYSKKIQYRTIEFIESPPMISCRMILTLRLIEEVSIDHERRGE